jgi:hypothetical protein
LQPLIRRRRRLLCDTLAHRPIAECETREKSEKSAT